jgi:ADP-heptose:LPS heptosyltransferase
MMLLKKIVKYLIYYYVHFFTITKAHHAKKSLVILRVDAIGDYVLFRNFLATLKDSDRYKDYHITLIGNSIWSSIAKELDATYVDEFIWMDRAKMDSSFIALYKTLKQLASRRYDLLLSPTYSREFFYVDNMVKLIPAKEKVGSKGDLLLMTAHQKEIGDTYYSRLIELEDEKSFEFYRNKDFFEKFLDEKVMISRPSIELAPRSLSFTLPKNYLLLFIGASDRKRKWSIEKFAHIANYLSLHYDYTLVLSGGPSDMEDAELFKKYFKKEFVDFVGKTSLFEFLYLLKESKLIISNETSAPHFAVALGVEALIVLSNGNHYGRFNPYPKEIVEGYRVLYPPIIEAYRDDDAYLCEKYGKGSDLDINEISEEKVIVSIKRLL